MEQQSVRVLKNGPVKAPYEKEIRNDFMACISRMTLITFWG